jgi:4-hydroxy-4-methyl-2-oxoglutarate aldolase
LSVQSEMGHVAVIPPQVVGDVPRLNPEWMERFATAAVCDVSDAVGQLYTMSGGIGPLYRPTPKLVGQALTVKCWPGDNLAIYGALSRVRDGDVLVVDARGYTGSCGSGANVLEVPRRLGLRGIVIDGAWRDVDDIQSVGLPVFGVERSPFSPPKRRPGEINVPVSCGGVVVQPGDLVVGDAEGVAVVPRPHLSAVWEAVAAAQQRPNEAAAEASARQRADYYEQIFKSSGGVQSPWPEDSSEGVPSR